MYNIELDTIKKLFIIKGIGVYKEGELVEFINELKSKISLINPSKYKLVLDTSKLKTSNKDSMPLMNSIIKIYLETPFQNRFYVQSESVVANLQMKRTGTNELFDKLTVIGSIEEAYIV